MDLVKLGEIANNIVRQIGKSWELIDTNLIIIKNIFLI
jgi:hypothetical protein